MLKTFTIVAVSFLGAVATSAATLPTPSYATTLKLQEIEVLNSSQTQETATKEVAPEKPKEKRLICKGCNENENVALAYFQGIGIKDKNALATIMGNIRQESTFIPNICEGGSRTSYYNCGRGYGLIQFTSASRYYGLGAFAKKIGGNPSTADTQLRYITTEPQWKSIENRMRVSGKSIDRYMNYAYEWIGWGHSGSRTYYAHDYAKRLVPVEVETDV